MEYAMLAVVVNAAAGRCDSAREISMAEIQTAAETGMSQVRQIIQVMESASGR
jgi:purine nucleoside phosphorylase